jgi:hypothetical protein
LLEPLGEDEEEVESDEDSILPLLEVFMPPGDMEAAHRMDVVYIEGLPPFSSPFAAFAEAMFLELPGLYVSGFGSSIGDLYAKFQSEEDREMAMLHQPFHLDGANFRLIREEESDRVPVDMQWVALVLARRVPVEHLGHLNVAASFSCFGERLEVDAACLSGADYADVRAVVRLKHERLSPPRCFSLGPLGGPVSSPCARCGSGASADPTTATASMSPSSAHSRLLSSIIVWEPCPWFLRASHRPLPADNDSRGDPGVGGCDDALDAHAALLVVLDSVATSPEHGPPSPPTTASSSSTITISWSSLLSFGDADSFMGSGLPLAFTRRRGVVITELEPETTAPVVAAPVAPSAAWKRNTRLTLKEPAHYEPVEVRAMKLRGLKDALGTYTAALQKEVLNHGALTAHAKPLRNRVVAALAAAICASAPSVHAGDDV